LTTSTAWTTSTTSALERRRALAHLRKTDARLARVIASVGACRFTQRTEGTHFDALLRAIVYQQLSGKAASTILGRVLAIYGGRYPTAAELLATPDERLRAAGLSRQKLSYMRDLAQRVQEGTLPIDQLHDLDDAQIIEALTAVKGIGRWSAQMFLMFRLGRPDVLPELDLGIRKGLQRAYRMRKLPTPKRVQAIGSRWSPYATYACWYLWRSLDGDANLAD
jgi:DNA-3-methyladenine glycosylase II